MQTSLNIDQKALSEFCSQNGIKRLSLFGSQLAGTAGCESDIDLLVEFEDGKKPGLIGMARMEADLSALLGNQKVDLRTVEDLSRFFRDEVVRQAGVVYSMLSEEEYQFIEGVSQDALAELWEDEEENVWAEWQYNWISHKLKPKLQMEEAKLLDRIETDANVMVGKPVIKNTRLTVEYILGLLAEGAGEEEILSEYQNLTREDIQACLLFAKKALAESSFLPLSPEAL